MCIYIYDNIVCNVLCTVLHDTKYTFGLHQYQDRHAFRALFVCIHSLSYCVWNVHMNSTIPLTPGTAR